MHCEQLRCIAKRHVACADAHAAFAGNHVQLQNNTTALEITMQRPCRVPGHAESQQAACRIMHSSHHAALQQQITMLYLQAATPPSHHTAQFHISQCRIQNQRIQQSQRLRPLQTGTAPITHATNQPSHFTCTPDESDACKAR
jgi:hypothetical protein